MSKIIHVYKKSYQNPKHSYLGSTKDIMSRKEYFESRKIEVDEILAVDKTKYDLCFQENINIAWEKYDAVLLEMTFSPKAIKYIKAKSPNTKVIVRSHNAELLHRLHWAYAEKCNRKRIRYFFQAIKYFYSDIQSGKYADAILSIDEWETQKYWPHICDPRKILYLPFFLTYRYEQKLKNNVIKKYSCVNFTSSSMNPIIFDATKNFLNLVKIADGSIDDWKFYITGNTLDLNLTLPMNTKQTGWLEDPYEILKEARAMALLSNLGYGFKTKILEAIVSRAFILMPDGLYKRIPDLVKKFCIPVDIKSKSSFLSALERCSVPFPENNINQKLREIAYKTMDTVFED